MDTVIELTDDASLAVLIDSLFEIGATNLEICALRRAIERHDVERCVQLVNRIRQYREGR